MGLFSSKTITSVSSTTFPMFDPTKRVDNFEAAMIDHTSTLKVEQSEYLRTHYNTSKLKNFWNLQNWAERSGFYNALGRITTTFYGDAKLDNEAIGEALRPYLNIPSNVEDYGVYDSSLGFFSEDFFIKHLATQQGKASWFYDKTSADYTISYPTSGYIRATLKNGNYVEGKLPTFTGSTRFLEISYNIITKTVVEQPAEPEKPSEPDVQPEQPTNPPVKVTTYEYIYGSYLYQENTGIPKLDAIIANNGIRGEQSFYPVIPLRTNTSWIRDWREKYINEALIQLQLYDAKKNRNKALEILRDGCEKGMKEGNINDIDYITLILGVSINSRDPSDQKYLFEFFFNCYTNYAISIGEQPQSFIGGKPLYGGNGSFNGLFSRLIAALRGGQDDKYYSQFHLYNPTSNFNFTYGWIASDYYAANGKFKPDAKVGDYGTLAGQYTYTYRHQVPATDDEGNVIIRGDSESGYEVVMEWETVTTTYNLTFFCYQFSPSRWKAIVFADLKLVNLVYAGKSINTDAFNAVKDSNSTATLSHDFSGDYDGAYQTWTLLNFTYVEHPGEDPSSFIVPLEKNTLYECGVKAALDISYGCYFLVFNCWVQKKKKWYENMWLVVLVCNISMAICPLPLTIVPILATINAIALTVIALQMTTKILSIIFGERMAVQIVKIVLQVVKAVINIIASIAIKIPGIGWIIWGIAVAAMFVVSAAEVLWLGGTWGQALKAGAISALTTAVSSVAASAISGATSAGSSAIGSAASSGASAATSVGASTATSTGTSAGISGFLGQSVTVMGTQMTAGSFIAMSAAQGFVSSSVGSLLNGESLGKSLKSGITAGAMQGAMAALTVGANNLGLSDSLKGDTLDFSRMTASNLVDIGTNAFMGQLVNINTFGNLLQMGMAERQYHKMANLENDYQEFNNKAASAIKVLNQLAESISGTVTMESVNRLQACLGRTLSAFPDTNQSMSPEAFLSVAVMSGSDSCKIVLGCIDTWCDAQLTMDGYSPSDLHYSTFSNTLAWDSGLSTGV